MTENPAPSGKDGASDIAPRKEGLSVEPAEENRQIGVREEFYFHQGPLPSPEVFSAYPESARDKIIEVFVQESRHRQGLDKEAYGLEKTEQSNRYKYATRGQYLDFVVVLLFFPASVWLIHNGHGGYGGALLAAMLLKIFGRVLKKIGAFIGELVSGKNGKENSE